MTCWFKETAQPFSSQWLSDAKAHQLTLTKPPGALGRLEALSVQFSAFQSTIKPAVERIEIAVFAGDHGIAEEGVSAFPQAVTGEMIKNFAGGGAAISVMSRQLSANLSVINVGSVHALPEINGVMDRRIASGTANMLRDNAMTPDQCQAALSEGKQIAENAAQRKAQIFIGGEMGIANTTSAACLAAALLKIDAQKLAGPGTGLEQDKVRYKAEVIQRVLRYHADKHDAIDVLAAMGGFEIAALVGAYIRCAQSGIPILIDGYIATAAALVAVHINDSIKPWLIASHRSAEPAHHMMLAALDLQPIIELEMRLGEGSGAAVTVPLIQAACRLQSEMASFQAAGVSEKLVD